MKLYRSDVVGDMSVERLNESRAFSIDGELFLYAIGTTSKKGVGNSVTMDLYDAGWIARQGYSGVVLIGPDVASEMDLDADEADDRNVLVAYPGDANIIYSSLKEVEHVYGGSNPMCDHKVRLSVIGTEGRLAFTHCDRQWTISVDECGTIWEEMTDPTTGGVMLRLEDRDFSGFERDLWGFRKPVTA